MTAVSHVETPVVAVARLPTEVQDDVCLGGVELDLAVRVLTIATFLSRPATSVACDWGSSGILNISSSNTQEFILVYHTEIGKCLFWRYSFLEIIVKTARLIKFLIFVCVYDWRLHYNFFVTVPGMMTWHWRRSVQFWSFFVSLCYVPAEPSYNQVTLASLRDQWLDCVRGLRDSVPGKLSVDAQYWVSVSTSTSRDHRSGQGSTVNCHPDTPHILLYTTPTTPTAPTSPTAIGYNIGYAIIPQKIKMREIYYFYYIKHFSVVQSSRTNH